MWKRLICYIFHWRCLTGRITGPYEIEYRCSKCGLLWHEHAQT